MTRGALAIFVLAFAIRLVTIAELRDEPLFRSPQLDALEYVTWGARLARGDFTWPAAPIHGPGYPFLIGAILALTNSLLALQIVQAFLGSVAAALTSSTTTRFFGPVAGLAAGMLHATYAPLILIDVSIIAEGFFVFLLTLALWLITRISTHSIIAAGLVLGLAIIVRPTAAVLIPLFALVVMRETARRALAVAIFLAAVACPVLPVLIQNGSIQSAGGRNFYIGNSPLHDGTAWARPGGTWDLLQGAPWRARAADADRFHMRQTFDEIREHPARFAALLGSKLVWLTQDEEVRDSHSFHFFAQSSVIVRSLPRFGVVLALAIASAFSLARRRGGEGGRRPDEGEFFASALTRRFAPPSPASGRGYCWWLMTGYIVLMALTFVGLVAGYRYRIPIMPGLFVFAGAVFAERRPRILRAAAVIFVLVVILSNVRIHPPSHSFAEEVAASALSLKNEGALDDAAGYAARATTLDPQSDFAWTVAGDIAALRGRWNEAERAWRRAISVDANNARAWSHLAHVYLRRRDMARAEAMLKRALSIKHEPEAAENLAKLR